VGKNSLVMPSSEGGQNDSMVSINKTNNISMQR